MEIKSLSDLYKAIGFTEATVYVAPLIPFQNTNTSYLYNLYKPLYDNGHFKVKSVSVFSHFKPIFHALFNKKILFHYHWLEFQDAKALAGMPYKLLCIYLFTLFGGTLIWTVHNKQPHDQNLLTFHLKLHKWMAKKAAAVHVHCKTAKAFTKQKLELPGNKIFILNHPSFYVNNISKKEALDGLQNEYKITLTSGQPIWLIFGQISPYKGIEELINSIQKLGVEPQLIIAGPIKKGNTELGKRLRQFAESNSSTYLVDKFIPDEHVTYFFCCADLCLFNYREILSSGVVQLALDYGTQILAPKKGCISELDSYENVLLFEGDAQRDEYIISKYKEVMNGQT